MNKFVAAGVIMAVGVAVGFYGLIQMGYYEQQMKYWHDKGQEAQSNGLTELANECYNKSDDAFKARLTWGSIGTAGSGSAILFLVIALWWMAKNEEPDLERVERKEREREAKRKEVEDAEMGKEKGQD